MLHSRKIGVILLSSLSRRETWTISKTSLTQSSHRASYDDTLTSRTLPSETGLSSIRCQLCRAIQQARHDIHREGICHGGQDNTESASCWNSSTNWKSSGAGNLACMNFLELLMGYFPARQNAYICTPEALKIVALQSSYVQVFCKILGSRFRLQRLSCIAAQARLQILETCLLHWSRQIQDALLHNAAHSVQDAGTSLALIGNIISQSVAICIVPTNQQRHRNLGKLLQRWNSCQTKDWGIHSCSTIAQRHGA